jgi:hypothetical protein
MSLLRVLRVCRTGNVSRAAAAAADSFPGLAPGSESAVLRSAPQIFTVLHVYHLRR